MDDNEKIRNVVRLSFLKILSNLNQHLEKDSPSEDDLNLSLDLLSEKFNRLEELDKINLENMLNSKMAESEIAQVLHEVDEYKMKFSRAKLQVENKLTKSSSKNFQLSNSFPENNVEGNRAFLLPKIEIKKFNGNVKDWLYFWSQFKKIHEDKSLDKEDKFQYLINAMEKDSKASELVQSYPCTGDNYDKALTKLKMRFGRDELLIEAYIRSILELILKNTTKCGKNISLPKIYDKLQIYINALESIGTLTDNCGIIICTLVELSLSDDVLRTWKKHHNSVNMNTEETRLMKLMEFLRTEVEHEESIYLLGEKTIDDSVDSKKKKSTISKKKKKKVDKNSSEGLLSFLSYSTRRLFRVLIRKVE